jgi:hypothetical protein
MFGALLLLCFVLLKIFFCAHPYWCCQEVPTEHTDGAKELSNHEREKLLPADKQKPTTVSLLMMAHQI